MQWSDIQFDPPRTMLRQFAALWIAFFGGFALWHALVRGNPTLATVFAVLALTECLYMELQAQGAPIAVSVVHRARWPHRSSRTRSRWKGLPAPTRTARPCGPCCGTRA